MDLKVLHSSTNSALCGRKKH